MNNLDNESCETQKVYELLNSSWFQEWYDEKFVPHVEGESSAPSKREILTELNERLKVCDRKKG